MLVKSNYVLKEQEKMTLPGAIIDLPTLTEKDEDDIVDFGLKKGIDFIAASFIRKASDIASYREALGARGQHVKILAKIENHEGLHNFDEILEASDGIIIVRRSLSLEIPSEKVFVA